jgi:pyruvate dehydrogenase E1 component alpha subunit
VKKVVASFNIEYIQVMDENGNIDDSLMPDLPEPKLKELYHLMVLIRTFDEKMFKLQRSGKIGTYAQVRGEEASETGSAYALEPTDWVCPSFRETGVFLVRKMDLIRLIQSWKGDTRALKGLKGSRDLPICIPIGTQTLYACGIAWAAKLRGEKTAVITYFGEGGTSEGDTNEAFNFAGVHKLPVIFFCQNNQWAISTPRKMQTASETIAQKAIAFGIKGVQVDGNDVIAVYRMTKEALERARNGEGPTLIESITYRMADHTTSDDASRYRPVEEVNAWLAKDPIERLKKYFQKIGTWSDDYGKWVYDTVNREIDVAIDSAMQIPKPEPDELFDNVWSRITKELEEQKKELKEEIIDKQKYDGGDGK